ncbi:MAG: MOSC domain-containing protein [Anaerolineales bacterium]
MVSVKHLTMEELEAGMETILQSPKDNGVLEMIVRRPEIDARELLDEGHLDLAEGLIGDNWKARGGGKNGQRPANPDAQLTLMNARVITLVAQQRERWPLAGDQLFVDLDLSTDNLPPGLRLALGGAVIEVTALPHTGCKKFMARFGLDALEFVNSPLGKQLHMRGINTKIVQPGKICVGDVVTKV